MSWYSLRGIGKRLRPLFARNAVEHELNEEVAFHIDMEVERLMADGMNEADARRAALVEFGGVERYKEQVRQARWIRWVEDLLMDIRYAMRSMVRYRGFSAAVVLTLALGIGGTTAIFSVVDGLFLRTPEGVKEAASVRRLLIQRDDGSLRTGEKGGAGSYIDFETMRDGMRTLDGVATYVTRQADLGRGPDAEQLRATAASANYFDVLGIRPALGRFFTAEEDRVAGAHPVVVISHGMWQRRLGGARDALGSVLTINGEPLTIIGVAEKGFTGTTSDATDIWVTMAMAGPLAFMSTMGGGDWRSHEGMIAIDWVARLRPGATDEQVMADGTAALTRRAETYPGLDQTPKLLLRTLTAAEDTRHAKMTKVSVWLGLLSAIALIIACANVANLLLARSLARRRELALRLSLGAARGRIVRQSMTESIVFAVLGGVAGALLAHWSSGLLKYFELPPWAGKTDLRLLTFAFGISLLTGLLFGILPALRSVRVDPLRGMQDTRVLPSVSGNYTRRALVVVQMALSLMLLVGATLFVRSLREVLAIDAGVDIDRLVTVDIDLDKVGFSAAERAAFWDEARAQLARVPGVESSALAQFPPFAGMSYSGRFEVPGVEVPAFEAGGPYWNNIGTDYFRTSGTRLLEGRDFHASDARGEPVAIVSRVIADAIAPDGRAVGRCVQVGEQTKEGGCTRIIGVAEDHRRYYLQELPTATMLYLFNNSQFDGWGGPSLIVRTRGNANDHVAAIRAALAGVRSDLPFVQVRPITEIIRPSLRPYQLAAALSGMFSVLALILAAVGLYGVLGFFVSERRPEIGIRRSLGAQSGSVITLVVRQSLTPVLVGLIIGLAAAFAGTRFLDALLFGIEARDPLSFGLAVLFLAVVSAVATLIPALRAARVDPMIALRTD